MPRSSRAAKPVNSRTRAKARDVAPDQRHQHMLAVLKQFRVVIRNIKTHYQDVVKITGVSGAQLWALSVIAAKPGIKVGELAAALAIHQSTASNLLDRLSQLGYIERRREGSDLRVVTIYLSKTGQVAVKNAPQPAIGLLQNALLSLSDESLAGLHAHLRELIETIGLKRKTGEATPISMFIVDDDH